MSETRSIRTLNEKCLKTRLLLRRKTTSVLLDACVYFNKLCLGRAILDDGAIHSNLSVTSFQQFIDEFTDSSHKNHNKNHHLREIYKLISKFFGRKRFKRSFSHYDELKLKNIHGPLVLPLKAQQIQPVIQSEDTSKTKSVTWADKHPSHEDEFESYLMVQDFNYPPNIPKYAYKDLKILPKLMPKVYNLYSTLDPNLEDLHHNKIILSNIVIFDDVIQFEASSLKQLSNHFVEHTTNDSLILKQTTPQPDQVRTSSNICQCSTKCLRKIYIEYYINNDPTTPFELELKLFRTTNDMEIFDGSMIVENGVEKINFCVVHKICKDHIYVDDNKSQYYLIGI